MQVRVLYFGMIAEKLGKESETIKFEEELLPLDFGEWISENYKELEGLTFQIAMDEVIGAQLTKDVTTIAVLPPFAGG